MIIGVIKDISNIIKYENVKNENQFYELLTATTSHEMRTPLNAIIGLLQYLDSFVESERGKKLVKIIHNSALMLLSLVHDMLDLFQIKKGKF